MPCQVPPENLEITGNCSIRTIRYNGAMRFAALVGILIVAGCGKGDFSARSAPKAEELRLVYLNAPATFDPSQSQDIYTNDLMALVYQGLVGWGEDNKIEPRLADRWDVSPDGLTYTFHLRDAKFSDGRKVTAKDVKWTWERNASGAGGSPLVANYLGDVVGVKEVLAGKASEISGVTAVDDKTLTVVIDKPRPSFLGKLTYPATFVLPSGLLPLGQKILKPEQMVGAGPFVVESYTPDQSIKLAPNPHFFGGAIGLKGLTIRIVKDSSTRLNLFKSGEIDIVTLSQQDVGGMRADPKYGKQIQTVDRAATVYIGMNGKVYKPFSDPRVRRAFLMAVDRDFIADKILVGIGRKADGILPPAVPQRGGVKPRMPFDVAGAKALVKEAGWEGKLPPLDLWVNDANKDRKAIAEFVVTQLRDHLGVDAKLRLADATTIIQKATQKELGFFYGSWYADYLDAENFLSVLLSQYGQNRTNYDNPRFTELCRLADVEADPTRRAELYAEAEQLAITDCPWIPLYFPQEAVVTQPWVSGLQQNAFGLMPPIQAKVNRT